MPSARFEKAPGSKCSATASSISTPCCSGYARRWTSAGRMPHSDEAALAAIPEPARVLWLLVTFEGGVYNGGLASFLLQQSEWIIRGCLDALRAVGAQELLAMLEAGIPIAARSGAGVRRRAREGRLVVEAASAAREHLAVGPAMIVQGRCSRAS